MSMMGHGCVVWWPMLYVACARSAFGEVQRLVFVFATGALRSTATKALEVPLHTAVKAKADRLVRNGHWPVALVRAMERSGK